MAWCSVNKKRSDNLLTSLCEQKCDTYTNAKNNFSYVGIKFVYFVLRATKVLPSVDILHFEYRLRYVTESE
jgi:hypothetical protein